MTRRTLTEAIDSVHPDILRILSSDYSIIDKISSIRELGVSAKNTALQNRAEKSLTELDTVKADITYSFKNEVPESSGSLGTLSVEVQGDSELSATQQRVLDRLKATIALQIRNINLYDISGSNTVKEDIVEHLANTLISKFNAKLKKHKVQEAKRTVALKSKTPQLREVSGRFYSLALLKELLDRSLQDVVSANMGGGDRRDILNYRTGRFAASVQVERLTQNKEGMITAYYNYMKYPYQTFEPGFAQGSPKTRNPRLLIAKSIRELAASKVGNRLRSVLV